MPKKGLRRLIEAAIGSRFWPTRLCRHRHTTLPFNNRQHCLDCGCSRLYIFNSNFTEGRAGITKGPWRKRRVVSQNAHRLVASRLIDDAIAAGPRACRTETGGDPVRQISKSTITRKNRAQAIAIIARHLEQTPWSKGGQIIAASKGGRVTDGRVVASWPGARPAQIRAAARKLYDVTAAQVRREQLTAIPQMEVPATKPASTTRPIAAKPQTYSKPVPAPRNVVLKIATTLLALGKRLFSRKGGAK